MRAWLLLTALLCLPALLRASALGDARRAYDSATARYAARDYDGAAHLYLETIQRATTMPEDSVRALRADAYYNAACCYALVRHRERALASLDSAIACGFWDFAHIRLDTDLDWLRGDSSYDRTIDAGMALQGAFEDSMRARAILWRVPEARLPHPIPLAIVLHADNDRPENVLTLWRPIADSIPLALAALRAPRATSPQSFAYSLDPDSLDPLLRIALDSARRNPLIDPSRIVLVGYGTGGLLANILGFRHAAELLGIMDFDGYWNVRGVQASLHAAQRRGLCVAGTYDAGGAAIPASYLRAAQVLASAQINHWIAPRTRTELQSVDTLRAFLRWMLN